jgi:hypothetical protein
LPNYLDQYKDGDVLVIPRKYGGLCLPMQEALAHGIPVIMPDIEPNDYRVAETTGWSKPTKTNSFMTRTKSTSTKPTRITWHSRCASSVTKNSCVGQTKKQLKLERDCHGKNSTILPDDIRTDNSIVKSV